LLKHGGDFGTSWDVLRDVSFQVSNFETRVVSAAAAAAVVVAAAAAAVTLELSFEPVT
jgi:hypothetical protein